MQRKTNRSGGLLRPRLLAMAVVALAIAFLMWGGRAGPTGVRADDPNCDDTWWFTDELCVDANGTTPAVDLSATYPIGVPFTVSIHVADVDISKYSGYQFKLGFEETIVNALAGAGNSNICTGTDCEPAVQQVISNLPDGLGQGTVWDGQIRSPVSYTTFEGPVYNITMVCLTPGWSPLDLRPPPSDPLGEDSRVYDFNLWTTHTTDATVTCSDPETMTAVGPAGPQPIGGAFTVDIDAYNDESDFAGYQYMLSYDSSIVHATMVTQIKPAGMTTCGDTAFNNEWNPGLALDTGCFKLPLPVGPFSGTLGTVQMTCIAPGVSTLHLVTLPEDDTYGSTLKTYVAPLPTALVDGSVTCQGRSDISVVKTASVATATAGVPFNYTLTVTNNGPDPARGLVVFDALPDPADNDGRGDKDFIACSVDLDLNGDTTLDATGAPCIPGFYGPWPNPFPPPALFNSMVLASITPTLLAELPSSGRVIVNLTVVAPSSDVVANLNLGGAFLTGLFGEPSPSVDANPANESPGCDSLPVPPYNLGCEITLVVAPPCTDRDGDTSCRDPANDADDDGCTAAQEAALGANFSDDNWYDVLDVPVPANADPTANGLRNRKVDLGDVLAVLFYAFAENDKPPNANNVDYDSLKGISPPHDSYLEAGVLFDRSPGELPVGGGVDPAGAPNGKVDLGDVLAALAQAFVVNCIGPD